MKTYFIILVSLCLARVLPAQSGNNPSPAPGARPSVPPPAQLRLFGLVADAAEAQPLLQEYTAEKERLFEERRAVLVGMQGKTSEERLRLWQTMVEAQRERMIRQREREHRLSAFQKLEREKHASQKPGGKS